MVLGFANFELFTRFQTTDADRRATLQNDLSFILEFMARDIVRAIGDVNTPPVVRTYDNGWRIEICLDTNPNGQQDNNDRWVAYWFRDGTANPASDRYQMWYCGECLSRPNPCDLTRCNNPWRDSILSRRISNFNPNYPVGFNWVEVNLTACWDPDGQPRACGTPMNAEVTMTTRANMLSASAQ